jgi:hypothetical protein
MKRFADASENLFGHNSFDDMSVGEFFLTRYTSKLDCIERANWVMSNVPEFEGSRLLEMEDHSLLNDALNAYIFGCYAAVILTSVAFRERLLTHAVEIRGDNRAARQGFAEILTSAQRFGIVEKYIIDRIRRLLPREGPDSSWRLFRRSLQTRLEVEALLKDDAKEALCLMRGIVNRVQRWFPRQGLPGHPSIREELLRR